MFSFIEEYDCLRTSAQRYAARLFLKYGKCLWFVILFWGVSCGEPIKIYFQIRIKVFFTVNYSNYYVFLNQNSLKYGHIMVLEYI